MDKVTLTLEWCGYSPGDVVEVDPLRAAWLIENGYAKKLKPEIKLRPVIAEVSKPPVSDFPVSDRDRLLSDTETLLREP